MTITQKQFQRWTQITVTMALSMEECNSACLFVEALHGEQAGLCLWRASLGAPGGGQRAAVARMERRMRPEPAFIEVSACNANQKQLFRAGIIACSPLAILLF